MLISLARRALTIYRFSHAIIAIRLVEFVGGNVEFRVEKYVLVSTLS